MLSYAFRRVAAPARPTAPAGGTTFAATNPRPAAPDPVGGDLRIADFNVLNYFVDFPSQFGDNARGATKPTSSRKQQAKIVSAITALDADIVTLQEIENSAGPHARDALPGAPDAGGRAEQGAGRGHLGPVRRGRTRPAT